MDDFRKQAHKMLARGAEAQARRDATLITGARSNNSEHMFKNLRAQIEDFESGLEDDEELGISVANFGTVVDMHVRKLSYRLPSLIVFEGLTETGERIELVQHTSQVALLLKAVKPLDDEPVPIGFDTDDDDGEEE
jgi:hypothetical protein